MSRTLWGHPVEPAEVTHALTAAGRMPDAPPGHPSMVGQHSHKHASYGHGEGTTGAHAHMHEHGLNGTADADHSHHGGNPPPRPVDVPQNPNRKPPDDGDDTALSIADTAALMQAQIEAMLREEQ